MTAFQAEQKPDALLLGRSKPYAGESLIGLIADRAAQNFVHPRHILQLAGLSPSIEAVPFMSETKLRRLTQLLGFQGIDVAAHIYKPLLTEQGSPPMVDFGGVNVRRSHIDGGVRRIAPASLRRSNFVRASWMLRPLPFCTESWQVLTDKCLNPECGAPLRWLKVEHVAKCYACDADQREYDTRFLAPEIRPDLMLLSGLISSDPVTLFDALAQLPDRAAQHASGHLFEMAIMAARLMNPSIAVRSPDWPALLGKGAALLRDWPISFTRLVSEGDLAAAEQGLQTLSSQLQNNINSPSTIPAVRRILISDLQRHRGHGLGLFKELHHKMARERCMTVTQTAQWLKIRKCEVRALREADLFKTRTFSRGGRSFEWLTEASVAAVADALPARMSCAEFSEKTGLRLPAIEQLLEAGLIDRCDLPAVAVLFDSPQLDRETAEAFIQRLREVVVPVDMVDVTWIPLAQVMKVVGGRPKPWGAAFRSIFKSRAVLRAPMDASGFPSLAELHIGRGFMNDVESMATSFDDQIPRLSDWATTVEACELLNCEARELSYLLRLQHIASDPSRLVRGVCRVSLQQFSKRYISRGEIMARTGVRFRSCDCFFREKSIVEVIKGFAIRAQVEPVLGARTTPLGLWRRCVKKVSHEQVRQGRCDLSNREWDMVKAWVPRSRASRVGMNDRKVFDAALWISATQSEWKDLPLRYGDAGTCYGRFQSWEKRGHFRRMSAILKRQMIRDSGGFPSAISI